MAGFCLRGTSGRSDGLSEYLFIRTDCEVIGAVNTTSVARNRHWQFVDLAAFSSAIGLAMVAMGWPPWSRRYQPAKTLDRIRARDGDEVFREASEHVIEGVATLAEVRASK